MSVHCAMATSIDLPTVKVCVKQDFVFLLSAVADIHRSTCINEMESKENEECSVFKAIDLHKRRCEKDLCPNL